MYIQKVFFKFNASKLTGNIWTQNDVQTFVYTPYIP